MTQRTRTNALLPVALPLLTGVALLGLTGDAWAALEPAATGPSVTEGLNQNIQAVLSDSAVQTGLRVLLAILLFIVGWILAKLASYAMLQVLIRTKWDNVIAERLGLNLILPEASSENDRTIERFIAQIVYWLVMLLVIVGVLDYAGLEQVAAPIEGLVDTIAQALPRIGKAILIIVLGYLAGWILEKIITAALDRAKVDEHFAELAEDQTERNTPFSQVVGRVVFWLVFVVGLAGGFESLEIGPLATPLHNAIDRIVALLPQLGVAVLLVAAGYFGGRILRVLIRNILQGLGFDKLVARVQLDRVTGATSPSDVVGVVVMVFVIVQAVIAGLNKLNLDTLAVPLTEMMAQFWNLLPALAVSALIVVAGVFVGGLLRTVVAGALRNLGLDSFMEGIGFRKLAERDDKLGEYSEMIGFAAQVGVILVSVAQALANLDLILWAGYVNQFLRYVVQNVAVSIIIIGLGFAIANYVRDLIEAREGVDEGGVSWVAEIGRYAVLVFAFTMAVRQLDVAEDFVLLTFGLLFGGLCLGAAIAFGLGGKEIAGEIIKGRYTAAQEEMKKIKEPPPGE